jgi:hypothetical protein
VRKHGDGSIAIVQIVDHRQEIIFWRIVKFWINCWVCFENFVENFTSLQSPFCGAGY